MDAISLIIGLIVGLLIGAAVAVYAYRTARKKTRDEGAVLRVEAEKTLAEAQAKSRELLVVAKDEAIKVRDSAESEFKERRAEIQREEERQVRRRSDIEAQREKLDQRNKAADKRQQCGHHQNGAGQPGGSLARGSRIGGRLGRVGCGHGPDTNDRRRTKAMVRRLAFGTEWAAGCVRAGTR